MEEWKAIPGYEGYYDISTLGNVRVAKRRLRRIGRSGERYIQRTSTWKYKVLLDCEECQSVGYIKKWMYCDTLEEAIAQRDEWLNEIYDWFRRYVQSQMPSPP